MFTASEGKQPSVHQAVVQPRKAASLSLKEEGGPGTRGIEGKPQGSRASAETQLGLEGTSRTGDLHTGGRLEVWGLAWGVRAYG